MKELTFRDFINESNKVTLDQKGIKQFIKDFLGSKYRPENISVDKPKKNGLGLNFNVEISYFEDEDAENAYDYLDEELLTSAENRMYGANFPFDINGSVITLNISEWSLTNQDTHKQKLKLDIIHP